jgi:hypothetical protein
MTPRLALLVALASLSCVSSASQRKAQAQTDLGAAYLREGSLPTRWWRSSEP